MITFTIGFVASGPLVETEWPDLKRENCIHLGNDAPPVRLAVLDKGLESGRPSIALRLDLPDGKTVIAETTARLFCSAARAIMARYPDLFIND
jgi:hypothetical protein